MKHIAVIGAGISGLSISKMLAEKFHVKVFERSSKAGGLVKCDSINGAVFHRVGGHVFNSKNEVVLNWFWSHFDRDSEFIRARRNAKILLEDKQIGYPLENYLYQLPEDQAQIAIKELLQLQDDKDHLKPNNNFKEFLENSFGSTLYELYFGPYNSKLWDTELSLVPMEWLEGKLPMPDHESIILNNILRKEETNMVHAFFYYPKKGGSQFIIDRLAEKQDISLTDEIVDIRLSEDGKLLINKERVADRIVYCGDVRQLNTIIHIEDDALQAALTDVRSLASNGTSNVLCETDETELSWLYLPEAKYKAHRIIYTGNFSDSNNGKGERKTCVVEFSGERTETEMINELKHLPGDLKALAFNYEANSYIIHDKLTRSKIGTLKGQLEKYNIHLLGRFAEWEYYNMDKCIESAMSLAQQINATENND